MTTIVLGAASSDHRDIAVDLANLMSGGLLVQGNSGAGKSWAIRRLLERSWGQIQQIIIDPEGEFATLAEAFEHVLISGDRVTRVGAEALALHMRQHRYSVILDLSDLDRDRQVLAVTRILRALIDAPQSIWYPALVVVDEAHLFAGYGVGKDDIRKASADAMVDLASRGRKRGLRPVVATQRLARMAKGVASELSNLLMGRNLLDIDVSRAGEMLGLPRKKWPALRHLQPGEFVAFGPALSPGAIKVKIGDVETRHRGAAPDLDLPPCLSAAEAAAMIDELPETAPGDLDAPAAKVRQRGQQATDWTDEEIAIVRDGYAGGQSRQEIADLLGGRRSASAIGYIAGQLGIKQAGVEPPWTDGEIEILRAEYAKGTRPRVVAEMLGRKVGGITTKAWHLGIRINKEWTPVDRRRLMDAAESGERLVDVAAELGRNYAAVAKIAEKMGLSFSRGAASSSRIGWTPERIAQLESLWRSGKTPDECADALGASPNAILCAVSKFGLTAKYPRRPGRRVAVGKDSPAPTNDAAPKESAEPAPPRPLRASMDQIVAFLQAECRHVVVQTHRGTYLVDGRHSYQPAGLVGRANRLRDRRGLPPFVVVADSAPQVGCQQRLQPSRPGER